MRREFRIASVLLAMTLMVAAPALGAESASDESVLVFDLANPDSIVEEHTARLLWNLMTDNIVPERLDHVTGWNSLFLEEPQAVSGNVVVDLAAGTITGGIVERWACDNDCLTTTGTPSWTTTRDTGWTATITDGRVEPGTDAWVVTGSVAIVYNTDVTSVESPSDCNGTPCYVCQQQLCEVGGEATATAALEGWIDGDTLSLAFADRLEHDVTAMDLSDLRRTEFFMSRFSLTITGAVAAAVDEPPPEEPSAEEPGPEKTTSSDEATDVELPTGQVIPGVGAGSPPSDFDDDSATEEDEAADESAAEPTDTDEESLIPRLILAVALLVGVAAAMLLVRQIITSGQKRSAIEEGARARTAQKAAQDASAWFSGQATHLIEPGHRVWVLNPVLTKKATAAGAEPLAGAGPLPPSIQIPAQGPEGDAPYVLANIVDGVTVIHDPENPNVAVTRSGAQIWIDPEQLIPLPSGDFAPTHELVGTRAIQGQAEDAVYAYQPGTPVQVITTTGDQTLVRVDGKIRMWVPRSSVGPATAQIDPPP